MEAAWTLIFLLGSVHISCVGVSAQHLSYGDKIVGLHRLADSVEKSQIFTSKNKDGFIDEMDDILRNWDKTLLRIATTDFHAPAGGNVSNTCINHINLTLSHITEQWAQRMIDSLPKLPSGFFNGNLLWTGSYDECVNETAVIYQGPNRTNATYPFKGEYCRVGIPIAPLPDMGVDVQEQPIAPGELAVGLCVPNSCSRDDVFNLMNAALSFIPPQKNFTIQVRNVVCQKDELEYDGRAIVVTVLFSFILILMILGTSYDVFVVHKLHLDKAEAAVDRKPGGILQDPPEENESSNIKYRIRSNEQTPLLSGVTQKSIQEQQEQGTGKVGNLLLAFSVYTNGSKILSAKRRPGSLHALNGVRFISMAWVIQGHAWAFAAFDGNNIGSFILEIRSSFTFLAISNATVAVDTFFAISGLLVAFLTLKEIQRVGGISKFKWWLFYFHRFWRLTPPYMLVLALYVSLMRYWYNGPFWPQTGVEKNYCEDSWWKNILYINNFFKSKDTCMAWAWYLANDMQFYIVSPIFLIPLYYSGIIGGLVCGLFLLMSCIVSGTLSSVHNYPMSIFGGGGDPSQAGSYFDDYYVKPYCRVGVYVIGVMFGYLLYKTDCKARMSRKLNLFGWFIAAVCCLSVIYGPYGTYSGKAVASRDVIALYTALSRPVWSLGVCWVIFACVTGHGGIVNWFLSWKLFIPLSRLTYLAYLIHPVVMEVYYMAQRDGFYLNHLTLSYLFVAHLVISNAAAFVLSLAFESPFMGLEKVIFNRERRH